MNRDEALQVFDGVMLSDGSIDYNGNFRENLSGSKHMDWLYYQEDALTSIGVIMMAGHPKCETRTSKGKSFENCALYTKTSEFTKSQRLRWYPRGVKWVPDDVSITPVTLAHWFMGDGSSSYRKCRPGLVTLWLCTDSFLEVDVNKLIMCLRHAGLDGFGKYPSKSGYRLGTNDNRLIERFMDTVERFVLPSYRYKIKTRR